MKKVFMLLIVMLFGFGLVGCNESQDKINVDFIIDNKSHLVVIDKGTSISKDIIPLSNDEEVVELYYDENMENKYDDSILNEDSKMYVKNMGEEKLYKEVCKAYFDKFIKPVRENSSVEDVWIFEYLGTYGDSYVAIIIDRQNCVFTEEEYVMTIGNFEFAYSNGYLIYVYSKGTFLSLDVAYINNIISYEQLSHIYNKYYN